jgi:hypothetical protein
MTRTLPKVLRGALLLMVLCAACVAAQAQQSPRAPEAPKASGAPGPAPSEKLHRRVVITMDDLPGAMPASDGKVGALADVQRYNGSITAVFRKHHVPAIGFVNEAKVQVPGERDARAALLKLWLDAGLELGNHTYSHPDFSTTPVQEYEDETIRGEVITRSLLAAAGQKERYFRHPYLSTGATAEAKSEFEAFLKARIQRCTNRRAGGQRQITRGEGQSGISSLHHQLFRVLRGRFQEAVRPRNTAGALDSRQRDQFRNAGHVAHGHGATRLQLYFAG